MISLPWGVTPALSFLNQTMLQVREEDGCCHNWCQQSWLGHAGTAKFPNRPVGRGRSGRAGRALFSTAAGRERGVLRGAPEPCTALRGNVAGQRGLRAGTCRQHLGKVTDLVVAQHSYFTLCLPAARSILTRHLIYTGMALLPNHLILLI